MKRLNVSEIQKISLRQIAARHGFYIGRGTMSKSGSIDQLIQAIATGHAVVVPIQGDDHGVLEFELEAAEKLRNGGENEN